jgi:hypothetical protein
MLYLDAALTPGRRAAESRMTSTATVRRKSGTTTNADGFKVPAWVDVHTDLPFRLVPKGQHQVTIGGVSFSAATARGDMPWDTADLADDDLIEITAGEWVGEVLRLIEAVKGDQQTARRVPVESVARLSEWGP